MISRFAFFIRYYIPRTVRWGVVAVVGAFALITVTQAFIASSNNRVDENHNASVEEVRFFERVGAVYQFARYRIREMRFDRRDDHNSPHARTRGTLQKMRRDGKVNFDVVTVDGVKSLSGFFADLEITDLRGAASYIAKNTFEKVSVDYYKYGDKVYVVVWFNDGVPVNEMLIKEGYAKAVGNPPTNIVNRLMAEYYFNKAFRK